MTDDRFDKLMSFMVEFKEDFNQFKEELHEFKNEMYKFKDDMSIFRTDVNERFDRLDGNIDLLAMKHWKDEKDIDRIKNTMGLK